MNPTQKPLQIKVYSILLILAALLMALLGWSASAYYVPALCLCLLAALLWWRKAYLFLKGILMFNLLSGIFLILVLWLGEGLGSLKLDISGVMLITNLLCGGPLLSLLSLPMLLSLQQNKPLYQWFHLSLSKG